MNDFFVWWFNVPIQYLFILSDGTKENENGNEYQWRIIITLPKRHITFYILTLPGYRLQYEVADMVQSIRYQMKRRENRIALCIDDEHEYL